MRCWFRLPTSSTMHEQFCLTIDYSGIGYGCGSTPRRRIKLWYYGALVKTLHQTAAPKILVNKLERVVKELEAECAGSS
jgi:hypothetical protein